VACAPPKPDLFADLPNFSREIEVCEEPVDLSVVVSDLLNNYYGGDPKFLFQYNTRDPERRGDWENIENTILNTAEYTIADPTTHPIFDGLETGDQVYFRVISATESVLTPFANGTDRPDPRDLCKNYSVSDYSTITINCPECFRAQFDGLELTNPKDTALCIGTSTLLRPDASVQDSVKYQFYYSQTSNYALADSIDPAQIFNTGFSQQVTYANPGWYTLKMWDWRAPGELQCHVEHQIFIDSVSLPSYQFVGGDTVCAGDNPHTL